MKTLDTTSKLTTTAGAKGKPVTWNKDSMPGKDSESKLRELGTFAIPCSGESGAIAHWLVQHYENPETVKEIREKFNAEDHVRIFSVGLRKVTHAAGTEVLKDEFGDPEVKARKVEKLTAKAIVEINEWFQAEIKASGYPKADAYEAKQTEVYGKYGLELPS